MEANQSIIDKIQKLSALAERAGTEEEAASAGRKVAELCEKHNLEIGVAKLREDETSATEQSYSFGGRKQSHANGLCNAVEKLFDVGAYQTRRCEPVTVNGRVTRGKEETVIVFFGLRANVQSAYMTFEYLMESVEAMLKGWIRAGNRGINEDLRSFRLGCAHRIHEEAKKLVAPKRALQIEGSESLALVRLSNQIVAEHSAKMKLRSSGRSTGYGSSSAFAAGYAAGGRVDLHGARSNRMLN